jgi:hypothetical protein
LLTGYSESSHGPEAFWSLWPEIQLSDWACCYSTSSCGGPPASRSLFRPSPPPSPRPLRSQAEVPCPSLRRAGCLWPGWQCAHVNKPTTPRTSAYHPPIPPPPPPLTDEEARTAEYSGSQPTGSGRGAPGQTTSVGKPRFLLSNSRHSADRGNGILRPAARFRCIGGPRFLIGDDGTDLGVAYQSSQLYGG